VRFRLLPLLLVAALLVGACGDDGGGDDTAGGTTPAPVAEPTVTSGTIAGPTQGQVECARLAERYVRQARLLFDRQGTPSDALVDRVNGRLSEFDVIAGTAGCGEEYTTGVCDGLDDLANEGVLVIMPLLPPNGCG
jgi:hypothetical protein